MPHRQVLTVTAAAATKDLTTLARVKAELGISGTASDAELANVITEASDAIGTFCARPEGFGAETLTETYFLDGELDALVLTRDLAPAVSSVVEDGATLAGTDYMRDGSLLLRLGSDLLDEWDGRKIVVSYSAGYALPNGAPADLERCALELCATIWEGRGRDQTVRSESVDGVSAISYLDPRDGSRGLPATIADRLTSFIRVRA